MDLRYPAMNPLARRPNRLTALLATLALTALTLASSWLNAAPARPIKIFVLAGQSNMLGHGNIAPATSPGTLEYIFANDPTGIYQFLKDSGGEWAVRDDVFIRDQEPKNGGLTVSYGAWKDESIGPEVGIGHVLGNLNEEPVLLVKAAWGGKSLVADFRPPSSGGTTGFYYNEVKRLVKEATTDLAKYVPGYNDQGYEIVGFLWHQGFNDRIDEKASAEYETNMANFIRDMRSANQGLGAPNMKFVIATTGMGGGTELSTVEKAQLVMANTTKYPEFAGNVAVIDTRNPCKGLRFWYPKTDAPADEGYHWNRSAQTYLHIGLAMGDAMSILAPGRCPFDANATGSSTGGITISWRNGTEIPKSVRILRNGEEVAARAPSSPSSFTDNAALPGLLRYQLLFNMPGRSAPPLTSTFNSGITNLKATAAPKGLKLNWTNNMRYAGIRIGRNGTLSGTTLPGDTTTFTDPAPPNSGLVTYSVSSATGNSTPATIKLDLTLKYTHYRFTSKELRDDGEANSIQIAEFEFASGANVIDLSRATITNPGGRSPEGQETTKAADGDTSTKWLDFERKPLIFQFPTPTRVDRYRFATADDSEGRDPVSWKLEGSKDGNTWILLDERSFANVPIDRNTYTEAFGFVGAVVASPPSP